ncbi:MAG: hypothetical protein DHS20C15_13820 [Planctomycetota bacterium]|nr:MAG: hypothetical protein DHS20C15_13820 [Planctomycetota bacterium]
MLATRHTILRAVVLIAATLALTTATARTQDTTGDPFVWTFSELAPGVWAGVREDMGRTPVMGSTLFVIGDEGVVVFDGGGAALMSERLIAKIRELTELPVTHVVISHWHGDHNFGVHRFRDEFPGVQFVAHRFTRAAMTGPRMDYLADQAQQVPRLRAGYAPLLESGRNGRGDEVPEFKLARMRQFLADAELIHAENQRLAVTLPTLSFDDSLTIHSGARRIELLFLGDGNTAGDLVLWLPEERIVATGDLVVHPTPYGFNVPPARWAQSLRRLQALDYRVLVPGHGEIQRDMSYVGLLIEVCDAIVAQRESLLAEGVTLEELPARLDLSAFVTRFTHGDPDLTDTLRIWFMRPIRAAASKELEPGPMVEVR